MSGSQPSFCRSNTMHTLNVGSVNEASTALQFSRSKTVARSTFPNIIIPNRYKVFSRLREHWDPTKKEKAIKQRLLLATLTGVVNLRRMELKTIPDDMFYLEMDAEEKVKVKEKEETMLLSESKIHKHPCQMKTVTEPTTDTTVKLEKNTELIIEKHNISPSLNVKKTKEDDDDEDFKIFLHSYESKSGYVCSYGEIVKAYLKQRIANFIKKTEANRIPLIKHHLNKTSEKSSELNTPENMPLKLSVQTSEQTAAPVESSKSSEHIQAESGLTTKNIEEIQIECKTKELITVSHQAATGAIRKIPVQIPYDESILKTLGMLEKVKTVFRSPKMSENSVQIRTDIIKKIPINTPQSICREYSGLQTIIGSRLHATRMSKKTTREGSEILPQSKLSKTFKGRSLSTGNEGKLSMIGTNVAAYVTPRPKNPSKDIEHCYRVGYSLFVVNPYSGEEFCIINDIRDIEEIKFKVRSFLRDLHSNTQPSMLEEASKGESQFVKDMYPTLNSKDSHLTGKLEKVPQASSKDDQLQRTALKIPRSKVSKIPLASWNSTLKVKQTKFPTIDTSSSLIDSASNDPGSYSDFEIFPEKYIFFKGDSLMCENPSTGDKFCIFHNIRDIEEIKSKVTQFVLSCMLKSEKEVTSSPSAKEHSGTEVSPYTRSGPKIVSKIPVRKLPEYSRAFFIKIPDRKVKQLEHRTKDINMGSLSSVLNEKITTVASEVLSKKKASKIPRSITSTSTARARNDQSTITAPIRKTTKVDSTTSKIPISITSMSAARARGGQSPQLKIEKRKLSIDNINAGVIEPASEITLEEIWTQKDSKDEDNYIPAGEMDTCADEVDVERCLMREMSNLGINVKSQATSIPKYEPLDRKDGIPLLQADSCVSLLGVIRKTPVISHTKRSKIPRSTASSSAVTLTKSPVIPETKSKSFFQYTTELRKKEPLQKLSSDMSAASKRSKEWTTKSTDSEHGVIHKPKKHVAKSQKEIIRQKHGSEKQSSIQRISPVGLDIKKQSCPKHTKSQSTRDVKLLKKKTKNIDILILDNNKLTEMSWKIGYLTNLTTIYIMNNMIKNIPNEIKKLQKLVKLRLDYNKISFLPVGAYDLILLKHLSLKGNKFIHVPNLLRYLEKLESLDISHNYLTALPSGISELNNLKVLEVSRNEIRTVPQIFPPNLQEFFANENEIKSLPDLTNLTKLRVLSVKANKLTQLPRLAPSIKKIYASRNFIFDIDESLIENWSNLETLNVARNQLVRLPVNIDAMSSLKKLHLCHNEIRCLPRALGNIYCLDVLDMSNNPICGIPYHLLKGRDMFHLLKYIRHGARRFQLELSENEGDIEDVSEEEVEQTESFEETLSDIEEDTGSIKQVEGDTDSKSSPIFDFDDNVK